MTVLYTEKRKLYLFYSVKKLRAHCDRARSQFISPQFIGFLSISIGSFRYRCETMQHYVFIWCFPLVHITVLVKTLQFFSVCPCNPDTIASYRHHVTTHTSTKPFSLWFLTKQFWCFIKLTYFIFTNILKTDFHKKCVFFEKPLLHEATTFATATHDETGICTGALHLRVCGHSFVVCWPCAHVEVKAVYSQVRT